MKTFFRFAAVAVVLLSFASAKAQVTNPAIPMVPVGYCQLTSVSASTLISSCSGGIPSGANTAIIQAEAKNLRYRDDGTAPQAGVGVQIAAGASILYTGTLSAVRVIEEAASAKVNILFYRVQH